MPLGTLSEEALEARTKDVRRIRLSHVRTSSREVKSKDEIWKEQCIAGRDVNVNGCQQVVGAATNHYCCFGGNPLRQPSPPQPLR
jgi:hypothetical protein